VSDENIATARRIFDEVWGGVDLDLIDELCTEDFVNHDPVMGDSDRDGVKQVVSMYRAAFPDLEFAILDAFAAGDKVVIRWQGNGTFENAIMGQQPTGQRGDPIEGIAIDRFEDGKIAESWGQWDTLRFLRNIGAVPERIGAAAGG
jgi:predicted ester cyclase